MFSKITLSDLIQIYNSITRDIIIQWEYLLDNERQLAKTKINIQNVLGLQKMRLSMANSSIIAE